MVLGAESSAPPGGFADGRPLGRKAPPGGGSAPIEEAVDAGTRADEERWLRCAACGARIAREAARIAMNGAHEHRFMNPAGIRYVVGCFGSAPGCEPDGERSPVWTWFPGYAWQVEICRACATHLGWSFHRDASSFHALIRDRLA